MLSHVFVGTDDLARAIDFYDQVLEPLGIIRKFVENDRAWAGWKHVHDDRPLFLVGRPFDGAEPATGNGNMVAFQAPDRSSVDRCYQRALAAGGTCEGRPGLRPEYHPHYYGAYFRDPGGNKVCVCCHAPDPSD